MASKVTVSPVIGVFYELRERFRLHFREAASNSPPD